MLFYSFFKTLIGKPITVHLKNDVELSGTLLSADQFLNLKLDEVMVADQARHPHLLALKSVFIRGSVVRYVDVPKDAVDILALQDAARVEALNPAVSGGGAGVKKQHQQQQDDDDEAGGQSEQSDKEQ